MPYLNIGSKVMQRVGFQFLWHGIEKIYKIRVTRVWVFLEQAMHIFRVVKLEKLFLKEVV